MAFRRLVALADNAVTIHVDGIPVAARAGDSVAAALLASGLDIRRVHAASGAPRAPYCMMGVCFECLVAIDGVADRQSCLVTVKPGMVVTIKRPAEGESV